MCGIVGAAWTEGGRGPGDDALAAMMTRIVHRGPDDSGRLPRRPRRARVPPAVDRRPGGRPPAARERGRHGLDRLQRRDLQLPRLAATGSKRAGTPSARTATPRSSSTSTRTKGRDVRPAPRDVRPGDLGRPPAAAASWAATGSGQKPLVYRARRHAGSLFASELKALLALPEREVPRRVDPLAARPLPDLRLRAPPRHDPRGRAQAAAGALRRLARREARRSSATGTPTGTLERSLAPWTRTSSELREHAGRRRARADGRRRPARRVPLGGDRLDDHRRPDAAGVAAARCKTFSIGFDDPAFDESALRRDRRQAPRAPSTTRSASRPRRGRPCRPWPGSSTSRSPTARPAHLVRLARDPPRSDGRPDRRRRRRAVRRLRPLSRRRPGRACSTGSRPARGASWRAGGPGLAGLGARRRPACGRSAAGSRGSASRRWRATCAGSASSTSRPRRALLRRLARHPGRRRRRPRRGRPRLGAPTAPSPPPRAATRSPAPWSPTS